MSSKIIIPVKDNNKAPEKVHGLSMQFQRILQTCGISYILKETRTTTIIDPINSDFKGTKIFIKGLTPKELSFIKKVKNHFKGVVRPVRMRPYGECTRYNQNTRGMMPGGYIGFCEIDLTGAYWNVAFQLGYLTKDLYNEGNNSEVISKRVRLMALGSLAKKTVIELWEPPYKEPDRQIEESYLEVFWDNISYQTGLLMNEGFLKFPGDCIGYWVDALFIHQSKAAQLILFFKEKGYDTKIVPLKGIEVVEVKDKYRIDRISVEGERIMLPEFNPITGNSGKTLKSVLEVLRAAFEK